MVTSVLPLFVLNVLGFCSLDCLLYASRLPSASSSLHFLDIAFPGTLTKKAMTTMTNQMNTNSITIIFVSSVVYVDLVHRIILG